MRNSRVGGSISTLSSPIAMSSRITISREGRALSKRTGPKPGQDWMEKFVVHSGSRGGGRAKRHFDSMVPRVWLKFLPRMSCAPGLIETEILAGVDQGDLEKIIQATPIPRMGEPSEVASMVAFLLSEESNFTTGQTLVLSGGRGMLP